MALNWWNMNGWYRNLFTPRQINKGKTIKGDVLVTLRKSDILKKYKKPSDEVTISIFTRAIEQWLSRECLDTNEIFLRIMKMVFLERIVIGDVDLLRILVSQFKITEENNWTVYDKLKIC